MGGKDIELHIAPDEQSRKTGAPAVIPGTTELLRPHTVSQEYIGTASQLASPTASDGVPGHATQGYGTGQGGALSLRAAGTRTPGRIPL